MNDQNKNILNLEVSNFGFVSDFEFRASDFKRKGLYETGLA